MSADQDQPVFHLFGIPVNALSMAGALSVVDRTIGERGRLLIGVINAAKVVNMRRDRALREAMSRCDIILADGIAVVWAFRLLGQRLPGRVPGIDLMHAMLQAGMSRGYRVFLFGATEEVSVVVQQRIEEAYPGVVVAGRRNGYYEASEEREIVASIKASRPDILLVAMSPPKKEIFLSRWVEELGVPVCHGVGGAFDVLAGKVKRAPAVWQRWGMEWLYRVVQEPRRMWRRYLVTNATFGWMLAAAMWDRFRGRGGPES